MGWTDWLLLIALRVRTVVITELFFVEAHTDNLVKNAPVQLVFNGFEANEDLVNLGLRYYLLKFVLLQVDLANSASSLVDDVLVGDDIFVAVGDGLALSGKISRLV